MTVDAWMADGRKGVFFGGRGREGESCECLTSGKGRFALPSITTTITVNPNLATRNTAEKAQVMQNHESKLLLDFGRIETTNAVH